jgi:hypothetical protein
MGSPTRLRWVATAGWLWLACSMPASFRVVDLAEARVLLERDRLVAIEALPDTGTGARGSEAEVPPPTGVLIFGLDAKAARARAAAFARAGNQPVVVFIPRDAEERGRFYALASQRQESHRGKDS